MNAPLEVPHIFPHTWMTRCGYRGVMQRHVNEFGDVHWTAYIGIPQEHSLYGKDADTATHELSSPVELSYAAGSLPPSVRDLYPSAPWWFGLFNEHSATQTMLNAESVALALMWRKNV